MFGLLSKRNGSISKESSQDLMISDNNLKKKLKNSIKMIKHLKKLWNKQLKILTFSIAVLQLNQDLWT